MAGAARRDLTSGVQERWRGPNDVALTQHWETTRPCGCQGRIGVDGLVGLPVCVLGGEEVVVVGAGDDLPEHVVGEERDVRHDDEWVVCGGVEETVVLGWA